MGVLTNREATEQKTASFIHTIKRNTAQLHSRLESQSLLTALMMPSVTRRQYYCYLTLMKKVEDVYEDKILANLEGAIPVFTGRKASELIAADLLAIGDKLLPGVELHDYAIPGVISTPFALGFMYVMEGSKLGGKVIYKHINRTLGYTPDSGARFIADYGNDTFVFWKAFLSHLSNYVMENDCEEEAIQGAEFAFSSIYDFFELNRLVYES